MDSQLDSMPGSGFLPAQTGNALTMSSREIADLLDKRHDSVKRTMETLTAKGVIRFTQSVETSHDGAGARPVEVYLVNERDSYIIVAQLSPEFTASLVDYWQAHKNQRPMTTAEMFLQSAQILVDIQNGQARQQQELAAIGARVEAVEQVTPLKAKPQNAETISEIRKRMNKKFCLPERIVNDAMALGYAPTPCGMVKNSHADAQGSSFAVYWIKAVSSFFVRFVAECEIVSAVKATHPQIEGKFQLVKPA